MPADLNNPFGPSCCDGGATNCHQSAQPCGCDPGMRWYCAQHKFKAAAQELIKDWRTDYDGQTYAKDLEKLLEEF